MRPTRPVPARLRSPRRLPAAISAAIALTLLVASWAFPVPAQAATPEIGLGTADSFAVLAGAGITNTGPTTITGNVGSFPTQTQTGFASVTLTGTNHAGDAVTQQAKDDLVTAYGDAAGRGPTTEIPTDLGGQTLAPGVYDSAAGTFGNTGVLTLDGQGLTNPVFVFQTESTLITASNSSVVLINGADACNVYWQVGSSATLGTSSDLSGTIMALTSITMTTGATLEGRALARNGAVTMDTNTITRAACTEPTDTSTTVESGDTTTVTGETVTLTATVTASDSSTPTGTVEFFDGTTSLGTAAVGANGVAVLTTSALDEGTHTITAVYLGAPGYNASTSGNLTQIVSGSDTTSTTTTTAPTTTAPQAPRAPVTPATPTYTG